MKIRQDHANLYPFVFFLFLFLAKIFKDEKAKRAIHFNERESGSD